MNRHTMTLLHVAVWLILFLSPLMFSHDESISVARLLAYSVFPLCMLIVFYTNYAWLTPRHYVSRNERFYWVFNVVMIAVLAVAMHLWMQQLSSHIPHDGHPHPEPTPMRHAFFILRNMFNLAVVAAIATTIVLSMRWHQSEEARVQAEAERTEAELKNLRSQINPHFLLNTLNNIYALTAFDTAKAQDAIQQLSKLLRHMLYDNQQATVNLKDETQFIGNYVNLMKIRMPSNVDISYEVSLPEPCNVQIAPLIFISLIENAFKHGVSPTDQSFIRIDIHADQRHVKCSIENSNHPKTQFDRSGHGIGLQQVAKRLTLVYPQRHQWTRGTTNNGTVYQSVIDIDLDDASLASTNHTNKE